MVFLTAFRSDPARAEAKEIPAVGSAAAAPGGMMFTLTVSTDRELLNEIATAARELPEVAGVAEIYGSTRWLVSWNETDKPAIFPPPGLLIPMDVGSINPAEYQELLPEGARSQFLDLPPDSAIISRTAARLRGIEKDGYLLFQNRNIKVVGIVDDELTRSHEVIVTRPTGDALGGGQSPYLEVALISQEKAKEVEKELRRLVPPGVAVKIRGPLGSGFGDGGRLLSLGEIKTTFGEFPARIGMGIPIGIPQEWIDSQTALETVPLLGEFRCHKDMFAQIRGAIADIERAGLAYLIDSNDFGGCFSARFIRSGSSLSRHAWGIGIDFNVTSNLMGNRPTLDPRIIRIMEEWGFSWGGNWTVPDGMHFEFVNRRTE